MTSGKPVPTVEVVIGCDTDPDRESLVGPLPKDQLVWRGVTHGIPMLKASVSDLRDSNGRAPAFTWLLRADEQIRTLCGDFASLPVTHHAQFQALRASGDELGWHPHFWRRDASSGRWHQDTEDIAWQTTMLRDAHAALTAALSAPVRSVRMGWNYHNDDTFRTLEALGVQVDFSALPGFRTFDGVPPRHGENLFDWQDAPLRPYFPSTSGHRRRPSAGEGKSRLLELPIFVGDSRAWALARGAQLARKTRRLFPLADAVRRPTYFINLTARPALFAPLLDTLRRSIHARTDEPVVFATYFHPDELIANSSSLYDLAYVRVNLRALLATCSAQNAQVHFRTAAEVAQRMVASPSSTNRA